MEKSFNRTRLTVSHTADYTTPFKECKENTKAMRTVGLKTFLSLMIREYGFEKVLSELQSLGNHQFLHERIFSP